MKTPSNELLIGAHTSAAGGAYQALLQGKEIGATTVQLFTSNQKQWKGKNLTESEIALFQDTLAETGLSHIMSHAGYLINLGCPNRENLEKSRKAFKEELIRCHQLGITYLNFHPGAFLDSSEEQCLDTIVESLEELIPIVGEGSTRLLIEATAGQGSCVGHRFEHLGYLIKKLHKKIPIGVCVDTCHIFAAGYDLRTKAAQKATWEEFDREVGLSHLFALHLNDSLKPLGSKVDRHAALGKGEIGIHCFELLMQNPLTRELPKYLETPDGPELWKHEIKMLRTFA